MSVGRGSTTSPTPSPWTATSSVLCWSPPGFGPPGEHALISLLAPNGLRVSEATGADIEHLGLERGHRAGIGKAVTPHTLRHAFITAVLDAGVPLRDVQEAASHADPRTTMRYDRARGSLDRHATYIVAAYLAGAAR